MDTPPTAQNPTRRWTTAILCGCALVLLVLGLKPWLEARHALDVGQRYMVQDIGDKAMIPELTFAASQGWALGLGPEATGRLETLAPEAPSAAQGIVAASANTRGPWRSMTQPLESIGMDAQAQARADERTDAPVAWASLLAFLGLLGWWGGVVAWIWRGHDAKGDGQAHRSRWAALGAVGFVVWVVASALY